MKYCCRYTTKLFMKWLDIVARCNFYGTIWKMWLCIRPNAIEATSEAPCLRDTWAFEPNLDVVFISRRHEHRICGLVWDSLKLHLHNFQCPALCIQPSSIQHPWLLPTTRLKYHLKPPVHPREGTGNTLWKILCLHESIDLLSDICPNWGRRGDILRIFS